MTHYIMDPKMFEGLSCVCGFNECNGKTYQEHITLICDLSEDLKLKVLQSKTATEALSLLKDNNIKYTHDYNMRAEPDPPQK